MKCPACGSENRDDVNQCAYCGQRLAPKFPTPNEHDNPQNAYTGNTDPQPNWQSGQQWQNSQQNWQNTNPYNNPYNNPYGNQPPKQSNNYAIVSLVLAIASFFMLRIFWQFMPYISWQFMLCIFWPLTIGMDIAAIVVGAIALKKSPVGKDIAKAGIIVGGILLIACIMMLVLTIYLMNDPQFLKIYTDTWQQMYNESL